MGASVEQRRASNVLEPVLVDVDALDHLRLDPESKLFQLVDELFAIYQINRRGAVTDGLFGCFTREGSGRDEQTPVRSAYERPAEISNITRRYRALVSLALKQYVKVEQSTDLHDPFAVDAAIATAAGDLDLYETAFEILIASESTF